MTAAEGPARARLVAALAGGGLAGELVWLSLVSHSRLTDPLLGVLLVAAVAAELTRVRYQAGVYVSAAFACSMMAVAFLGPAPALVLVLATDLVAWAVERRQTIRLLINLFAVGLPSLIAATSFQALVAGLDHKSATFTIVLALIATGSLALNYWLTSGLVAILEGRPVLPSLKLPAAHFAPVALNVALTAAAVGIYAQYGLAVSAFLLIIVVAFNYMVHLVAQARERAKSYASLSWGVLSGLLRAIDVRDPQATRHSAAVAAFSRDIAVRAGMSAAEVELAHTAGLLHDVGTFALSDRVMERGGSLGEPDWHAVRQHPELGADMLRDLGLYGPVADIVRAHHERPDGRGYPYGLKDEEIPELAKIVAVAEVYDTLTAEGTYRERMNSFEALTELRRVSGKQLDARYVEILADLLAGKDTQYRHRDDADFYRELDLERRIEEAAAR